MAQAILELIPNVVQFVSDSTAGTLTMQVWNSSTSAWDTVQTLTFSSEEFSVAKLMTIVGGLTVNAGNVQLGNAAGDTVKSFYNTLDDGSGKVVISGATTIGTSLAIAGGTPITDIVVYAPSLTPVSVAAATSADQPFTVTGLATTDKVIVNGPALTAGCGIVNAYVSAANTLTLMFMNATSLAVIPTAGTYNIIAIRS